LQGACQPILEIFDLFGTGRVSHTGVAFEAESRADEGDSSGYEGEAERFEELDGSYTDYVSGSATGLQS